MTGFAKLSMKALLKVLQRRRSKLQVLDDLAKGKNLERTAMKTDPIYRAAIGKNPYVRDIYEKQVIDTGVFGEKALDNVMAKRPALRKEVTSLVKELRKRGGKASDYKYKGFNDIKGIQSELNQMKKQKAKYIKKGWRY